MLVFEFLSSRRNSTELPILKGKEVNSSTSETTPTPKLTCQQVCRQRLKCDPEHCPYCQTGRMKTIEFILPRSSLFAIKSIQKTIHKCAV
jgi:hypothetical protein